MELLHGSPIRGLTEILPSSRTGNIRAGEEGRRGFRDVAFFTTSWDQAQEYAGPGGSIYVVRARDAEPYAPLARGKSAKKAVGATIYVAPSAEAVTEYRLLPRRRGEVQLYDQV